MKHFKFLLWLFLSLVSVAGYGQDEINLDPIETTPIAPSARSLATGNWGYNALIGSNYDAIYQRATRKVAVYIFDTGGRYDHPGLQKAAWNERGRIFTGETDGADGNGHSTHVASSYAGVGQAGEAVGICDALLEKGLIRIVPIKVLDNSGSGTFGYTNAALDAVLPEVKTLISQGWFVVYNFSLGGGTAVLPDTESRLQAAKDAGVLIVAAAGNSGTEGVIFPAVGEASNAVAALNSSLTRASFSTYGADVWIATPGQAIYGCYPPNLYRELSGTSMATPHAGAVAALISSVYPTATARDVEAHMARYARDLGDTGRDPFYGYGFPNITAMLANAPGGGPVDPGPVCRIDAPKISVTCDDNGTPADASDDRYSYTITVTGNNTSDSYYILESKGAARERLSYGVQQGPFGPFPISGGNVSLGIYDTNDSACKASATAIAPAPCSSNPEPPKPARTQTFKVGKVYTVSFNTTANPKQQQLKFRVEASYTHTKSISTASADLTKIIDNHFRGRGYVLLPNNDEWEAAYWVQYFFRLIDGAKNGANITKVTILTSAGQEIDRTDFAKPSKVSARAASGIGVYTFKAGKADTFSQN